jgi:hypothetical protein
MGLNVGSGCVLAIGKEASWGTSHVDTLLVDFLSESIDAKPNKVKADTLVASKAKSALNLMGFTVGGDTPFVLRPEFAGYIFEAALGGTDTVTNPASTYCHTIVAAAAGATFPSYTLFVNRKQAIKKFTGSKVATLKITGKVGDYVRGVATWKCKDEATGTIATSTPASLAHYKFIGATVTAGAQALDVSGVEITIDNGMDDGIQLNTSGLYRSEPLHSERSITVKIDMPYDANSETIRETNLKAETLLSTLVIHLESPAIITAALKYRMDITLNNVAVTSEPVNIGGPGLITCSIQCEATAVGATEPISVAIYDATSGAYSA